MRSATPATIWTSNLPASKGQAGQQVSLAEPFGSLGPIKGNVRVNGVQSMLVSVDLNKKSIAIYLGLRCPAPDIKYFLNSSDHGAI